MTRNDTDTESDPDSDRSRKGAPNQAAAGKAAGALRFQFVTHRPGLPEPRRYPLSR